MSGWKDCNSFVLRIWVALSLFALLLITVGGCGGGTTGSDNGGFTRVFGEVKSSEGGSLESVSVIIGETGDSEVTDLDGKFELETLIDAGDLTFLVEGETVSASSRLIDVPDRPQSVEVVLEVDQTNNTVAIESSTIVDRDGNESEGSTPEPSDPFENTDPVTGDSFVLYNVAMNLSGLGELAAGSRLSFRETTARFRDREGVGRAVIRVPQNFLSMRFRTPLFNSFFGIDVPRRELDRLTVDATIYITPRANGRGFRWAALVTDERRRPSSVASPRPHFGSQAESAPEGWITPDMAVQLVIEVDATPDRLNPTLELGNAPSRSVIFRRPSDRKYVVWIDPFMEVPTDMTLLVSSRGQTVEVALGDLGIQSGVLDVILGAEKSDSGDLVALVTSISQR